MEFVLLVLRLTLAAIFGVAAFGKLFDPDGSRKAFADFGVPEGLQRPLVYLLPAAEILVAISLFFVETSWFGAVGAAGLLAVFSGGMIYQMAKGNAPDCHCFGQIHSEPVGASSVVRNVVFLGLALVLIAAGRNGQGLSLVNSTQDVMQFVIGIAVVALLGVAVMFLRRISEQQVQIMRRIELMDLIGRESETIERLDATDPHEGMPIGAMFPEFELASVDGSTVSLDKLKVDGKPTLFLFVSPTCAPCKSLIPEFSAWQTELSDTLNLVFISSGTAEANVEKFGGNDFRILLQKEREVADAVFAKWTPTAMYVDAHGRVASHVAAGDNAIRSLVEKIRSADDGEKASHFANFNGHTHENKIGADAPRFELTDIKGRKITTDYFKGKQTLVAFWSLTCGFCQGMLDDLRSWDKAKGQDEPNLIVFSDGDAAGNAQLGLESPVIVDEGYKTAAGFGMFGTPSAVLVNEEGKIVSETAIGAPFIWSLIGRKI